MKTAEDYLARKPHDCDEIPKPHWGIGPDGCQVLIGEDAGFIAGFEAWQAEACAHVRVGIIGWTNKGGHKCFNWYCAGCGSKLSSNIPHDLAEERCEAAHLDAMASRSLAYCDRRVTALREIKDEVAARLQPVRCAEYAEYRESEYWQQISARVIKRARGVCEGCLDEPAVLAHHTTYDHLGEEFAFELLALCSECHDRFHNPAKD